MKRSLGSNCYSNVYLYCYSGQEKSLFHIPPEFNIFLYTFFFNPPRRFEWFCLSCIENNGQFPQHKEERYLD